MIECLSPTQERVLTAEYFECARNYVCDFLEVELKSIDMVHDII